MKERIFPMSEREAKEKGEGKASIYNRHCKFARRMLSLRTEAGLSQQKVADLLEVSKSTISLYETGYTVPDAKTIYKLCDIYHVSADYLLCRTDYRATGSQSLSIEKYGFSERAAQNLKLVQMMELVAAKGKEPPLKSSALDLLCSSDQIGILCDYINQYRTLMQQTTYHVYDREMGAENVALTLKALPQRKEAELSLYCACETLKAILRAGTCSAPQNSEDAAKTGKK